MLTFNANRSLLSVIALILCGPSLLYAQTSGSHSDQQVENAGHVSTALQRAPLSMLTHLPLSFEENKAQDAHDSSFVARGAGYTLLIGSDELVLNLRESQSAATRPLTMKLLGAQKSELRGLNVSRTRANYYLGKNPASWRENVPTYHSVVDAQVYKGIDLIYRGNGRELEYDFRLAPGADATQVRMRFDGIVPVLRDNNLYFGDTSLLSLKALKAYQIVGQETRLVDANWAVNGDEASIHVGPYDESRELIIDPVFFYGAFVGGDDDAGGATKDVAVGIVPASQPGYYYVGLSSTSSEINLPKPGSTAQNPDKAGGTVILVIDTTNSLGPPSPLPPLQDIEPDNPTLVVDSVTYFGAVGSMTVPTSMSGDQASNLYVVGTTDDGANLPQLGGQVCTSSCSGFIAKFGTDAVAGSVTIKLQYSFGLPAKPAAIAVDQSGDTYLTGSAFLSPGSQGLTIPSSDLSFQKLVAPSLGQTKSHAFLLELNPAGAPLFCSYIGGADSEQGNAIALSGNSVFVAGETTSADFPGSSGAYQAKAPGGQDAFVLAASNLASSPALIFATLLGGTDTDTASSVAIAPSGNVIVAGSTKSVDFPTQPSPSFGIVKWPIVNSRGTGGGTPSAPKTPPIVAPLATAVPAGSQFAFVTSLSADGKHLIFTDFLGGNEAHDVTSADALSVDNIGAIYVAGSTSATTSGEGQQITEPFLSGLAIVDKAGSGALPPAGKTNPFFGEIDPSGKDLLEGTLAWSQGVNSVGGITISQPSAPAGIVSIIGTTDADAFYGARSSTLDTVSPDLPHKFAGGENLSASSGFFAQEALAGYCDMGLAVQAGSVFTFSGPCVSGTYSGTLFASADPANGKPPLVAAIAILPTAIYPLATATIDVSSLGSPSVKFALGFLPLGAIGGVGTCGVAFGALTGCSIITGGGGSGTVFKLTPGALNVQLTYDQSKPVLAGQSVTLHALVTNGTPNTVKWSSNDGTLSGPNPATDILFTPAGPGKAFVQAIPTVNPSYILLPLEIDVSVASPASALAITSSVSQMVDGSTYVFEANQSVTWTSDSGSFSSVVPGLFTAPDSSSSGTVTITAKSTTDPTMSVSEKIVLFPKLLVTAGQSVTLSAGKPAQLTLQVQTDTGVPGESILFSCRLATLPTGVSCSFSENPLTNSRSPTTTVTISSGPIAQGRPMGEEPWKRITMGGSSIVVAGCLLILRPRLKRNRFAALVVCCGFVGSLCLIACGTSGTLTSPAQPGHVTGTHQIQIDVQGATPNAADLNQLLATVPVNVTLQ